MSNRAFPIEDILSVTTGCLLSARGMSGLIDIIEHITGGCVTPLSMRRNVECAADHIHRELPWTLDVPAPVIDETASSDDIIASVKDYLMQQEEKYGKYHEISQLPTPQMKAGPRPIL